MNASSPTDSLLRFSGEAAPALPTSSMLDSNGVVVDSFEDGSRYCCESCGDGAKSLFLFPGDTPDVADQTTCGVVVSSCNGLSLRRGTTGDAVGSGSLLRGLRKADRAIFDRSVVEGPSEVEDSCITFTNRACSFAFRIGDMSTGCGAERGGSRRETSWMVLR